MTTLGKLAPSHGFGGCVYNLGHGVKTFGLGENFKQHSIGAMNVSRAWQSPHAKDNKSSPPRQSLWVSYARNKLQSLMLLPSGALKVVCALLRRSMEVALRNRFWSVPTRGDCCKALSATGEVRKCQTKSGSKHLKTVEK